MKKYISTELLDPGPYAAYKQYIVLVYMFALYTLFYIISVGKH